MAKLTYCPICDKQHDYGTTEKTVCCTIKGEEVECLQRYYVCCETGEEVAFEDGKMMNENLLAMRDAYRRKMGLLTSAEIKAIREKYHLTQTELALLLDLGEVTITRYETKQIQSDAYDEILRKVNNDPKYVFDQLVKHENDFAAERFSELKEIVSSLVADGVCLAKRKVLEQLYVKYSTPSLLNGNQSLDIDKIVDIISYFALKFGSLTKVKLMKLMWYTDMLFYRRHNRALTGLVYLHETYGALPHGHRELLALEDLDVVEEPVPNYENYSITIRSKKPLSDIHLTDSEINVLDTVISKFGLFTGSQLADYMHKEDAYKKTSMRQIISFAYAASLNNLK